MLHFFILITHLGALNSKDRVELLIKLMPYILPKTTSISHTTNEPLDWGI
jgi:hypothetical protein